MKDLLFTVISILVVCFNAHTQKQESVDRYIHRINESVLQYLDQKDMESALEVTNKAIQSCDNFSDTTKCKAGFLFIKAYTYHKASQWSLQGRMIKRARAAEAYEAVLKLSPDNQAAWSNLASLDGGLGLNIISLLKELAEKYPENRVKYLVRIGDQYLAIKYYDTACNYYDTAYHVDPSSRLACEAMTSLYTKIGVKCGAVKTPFQFAYYCQEIGYPQYSEQISRKAMTEAVASGDKKHLEESILVWVDVLASNRWLKADRLDYYRKEIFDSDENTTELHKYGNRILVELQIVLKEGVPAASSDLTFWSGYDSHIRIEDGPELYPLAVFLEVVFVKGERAYFDDQIKEAEKNWRFILSVVPNASPLRIKTVKDLAILYHSRPELDPTGEKLEGMVSSLFQGKGQAYSENDKKLIRKYHIALGEIFYERKIYEGGYAANASFQLERALSPIFGPIVNPDLRIKLAQVYRELGDYQKAGEAHFDAIKDMLALDRVKESYNQLQLLEKFIAENDMDQLRKQTRSLHRVVGIRNQFNDPQHVVHTQDIDVQGYLDKVYQSWNQLELLEKEFLQRQMFKALTDLGDRAASQKDRQYIYSEALHYIEDLETLDSRNDFDRLLRIKSQLQASVDRPRKMQTLQMRRNVDAPNAPVTKLENERIYQISGFDLEVRIPDELIDLNRLIREYYMQNRDTIDIAIPQIQLGNKEFRLKKHN